ncbi:preQ(1) synthase [Planctomycetota bacterium]
MAKKKESLPKKPAARILEVFKNEYPSRDYAIKIEVPEFTSVCPITGQPDFGRIIIEYIPGMLCVELKSLKFYMQSYRNYGAFYEKVVNMILDDLVKVLTPRYMQVEGEFNSRGGITTSVMAEYYEDDEAD